VVLLHVQVLRLRELGQPAVAADLLVKRAITELC
jgi:hypothetical protein